MADQLRTSVEVYEAKDGWRWRMKAGNGEIIADSAEAYATKANAERAVTRAWHSSRDPQWDADDAEAAAEEDLYKP